MLETRDATLLRGGRRALDRVSVALAAGEFVALCGPNGAGKSSLIALLTGELSPSSGDALLDGAPLARFSPPALAAQRAALDQTPILAAAFTVADLVALGMAAAPRAALDEAATAARAMAAVGVAAFAERPADHLSGGERARAHCARVLAQLHAGRAAGGGRFLLLDEPTASLDLAHQVEIMEAARAEAEAGAGVLAALHDLNLAAAYADRVVLLAEGRVVAEGPPDAVFEAELLGRVYGAPVSVERAACGALRIAPALTRRARINPLNAVRAAAE